MWKKKVSGRKWDHLVGNVYIKFKYETDAEQAVIDLTQQQLFWHSIPSLLLIDEQEKTDQTFLRTHGSKQTKANLVQGLRKY